MSSSLWVGAAAAVLLVASILLASCGPTTCSPQPQCPLLVSVVSSQVTAKPGQTITFTANPSNTHSCSPSYSWDFDGDGLFDDASGQTVSKAFAHPGLRVVAVRAADCVGSASAGANVWVSATSPRKCPAGKPFDLLWSATDANGLPLDPEWHWQCEYTGFAAGGLYPATYDDPNALCQNFSWTHDHHLDVGPNCSTRTLSTDVPNDPLWKTICHFIPDPPFQEPDTTVHGHVNWRSVTFGGVVSLERLQADFPFGDGDADLNLIPAPASGPQNYTVTLPGVTWENPASIHIEFTIDEVMKAFAASPGFGNSWSAALNGVGGTGHSWVPAVVIGMFGLDARHASYSEVHPIYAMALRESAGTGFSRWLIFARNEGDEGGCSSHSQLAFNRPAITMALPLPPGTTNLSTAGSRYASNTSTPPRVTVTSTGAFANVTVALPGPGQDDVTAGELILRASPTAGPPASALRAEAHVAPQFAAAIPARPQDPEDYLASLPAILSPSPRASALRVPLAQSARKPMSAAEACAFLQRMQAPGSFRRDPVEIHLSEQICKVAGMPFIVR